MSYSSFLPLCVYKFPTVGNLASIISHLFTQLFGSSTHARCSRVIHLYSSGRQLYQLEYNLTYTFFCFNVRDSLYSFPELLKSAPFPLYLSAKLFYTFVVQLDCFVRVCIPSWNSQTF